MFQTWNWAHGANPLIHSWYSAQTAENKRSKRRSSSSSLLLKFQRNTEQPCSSVLHSLAIQWNRPDDACAWPETRSEFGGAKRNAKTWSDDTTNTKKSKGARAGISFAQSRPSLAAGRDDDDALVFRYEITIGWCEDRSAGPRIGRQPRVRNCGEEAEGGKRWMARGTRSLGRQWTMANCLVTGSGSVALCNGD